MESEEGEWPKVWREGFSCHLVAVPETTLSSQAGEGNRSSWGTLAVCVGDQAVSFQITVGCSGASHRSHTLL